MITFIIPLFDKYSCNFYIFSLVSPKIGWMSSIRDSLNAFLIPRISLPCIFLNFNSRNTDNFIYFRNLKKRTLSC